MQQDPNRPHKRNREHQRTNGTIFMLPPPVYGALRSNGVQMSRTAVWILFCCAHTRTHTDTHGHTRTHTDTQGHTGTHTDTHGHTRTHTDTHGHTRTHTHTHTHTPHTTPEEGRGRGGFEGGVQLEAPKGHPSTMHRWKSKILAKS